MHSSASLFSYVSPASHHDAIPFLGLNAWVRAASQCEFNINPMVAEAGLQIDAQGVPYISRTSLVKLIKQCVAQAAPKYHFPLVIGPAYAFDYLPAIETFITTSANLREALPLLSWLKQLFKNSFQLNIEESGHQAALILELNNPENEHERVVGYFIESIMAVLVKFLRMIVGESEFSFQIQVKYDPGPQRIACEQYFGSSMLIHQSRNAIVFNSALLDQALPGTIPELHRRAQQIIEEKLPRVTQGDIRVCTQIENLLLQQPHLLGQGINNVAEKMNLHLRTLQRRLSQEGQVFGEIQSRCRYQVAVNALKSENIDIELLSLQLGFADRQSFTRAFKRWTAQTPSEFRKQQVQLSSQLSTLST